MKKSLCFLLIFSVAWINGCKKKDDPTLVAITVTTQPTTKTYEVNGTFNPAGMEVTATYSDKSTKPVATSMLTYDYDFKSAGNKTVNITFTEKGKTVTTTVTGITVNAPPDNTLLSIEVTTDPSKMTYEVNDTFDPTDMVVTAKYSDKPNQTVTITPAMLSYDFSTAGTKTVTITYQGKTATVEGITVNALPEGVTLESIAVTTQPSKKTYEINDLFDLTDMVVTATYSDESTKTVTVTPAMLTYDFSTAGVKTVTITYQGKIATVTGITVNPESDIASIAVTILPDKRIYGIGETFDITGMEVTATYKDNSKEIISITATNLVYDFSTVGYKLITINYKGKTTRIEGNDISVLNFLGDGIIGDPYLIGNPLQLAKLAELVNDGNSGYINKYYELTANIDLSAYGVSINSGAGWIPIGNSTNQFKGHFDGAGHTVSNLYINSSGDNKGLFGYASSGTITDFGITNANVTGGNATGSVVGYLTNGSIINCYATGKVDGNENVGGVVGYVSISSVNNCYATSTVSGEDNVGGVMGYISNSSINNCYATGTVSGSNNSTGGIAGWINSSSEIANSYATGKVSGSISVGGVAGLLNNSSEIVNCYATGEVSGDYNVGGLAGGVDNGSIINCYATGDVSGRDGVGGVAGSVDNGGSIAKCYAIGKISGNDGVGGIVGFVWDSSINNCAALNKEIAQDNDSGSSFHRVAGSSDGTLSGNVAWNNMKVIGSTVSDSELNGTSIDKTEITGDGTIGGRFTTTDGWTILNGSLPGFGTTLTMPAHIQFD